MEKNITISNCTQCPHHEVISDPDPYDSFCSDDQAVICKKMDNINYKADSPHAADRQKYGCVTVGSRPYNVEKESKIPKWCPL